MYLLRIGIVSFVLAQFSVAGFAGEEFALEVPGQPRLGSQALIDDAKLVIVDATGQATIYTRDRSVDSQDGRYLGYYSSASRRYIRFPKSGAGSMHLADQGAVVTWRESQMQVRRIVARTGPAPVNQPLPGRVITNRPIGSRGDPFAASGNSTASLSFAVLSNRNQFQVASFDQRGALRLYSGSGRQWQAQTLHEVPVLDVSSSILLANGALATAPTVYGISTRGEFTALDNGQMIRNVFQRHRDAPSFVRGTQLTTLDNGRFILAIDNRARCLLIDPRAGDFLDLGPYRTQAIPGSRVVASRDANNQVHAFLTDRAGQLVRLSSDQFGRWDDTVIATGYQPGGHIATALLDRAAGQPQIYLASIDSQGTAQILREPYRRNIPVTGTNLQPGSPLAIAQQPHGELTIAAIDRRGSFAEWIYDTSWRPRVIGHDFIIGSPIWYRGVDPVCFGINRRGELISARYYRGAWDCYACDTLPGLIGYVPPRIISSETIPLPPLPPVTIRLVNRHKEELVIQWVDASRTVGESESLRIAAGDTIAKLVNRDAGARQVETVATQLPNGAIIQDTREYIIPPQPLYTLGVYENRVQSVYIDRTGKDLNPRQETKGLRSIGVFRLAPGDGLQEGTEIDVFATASRNNNPGAVQLLP